MVDTPVYDGHGLAAGFEASGPAIVELATTTIVVPEGFELLVDRRGSFVLAAGERGRKLADDLGVSRNTVIAAYDALLAEGYLDSVRGSGTRVAALPRSLGLKRASDRPSRLPPLSERGKRMASPYREAVSMKCYLAGHAIYRDAPARAGFAADMRAFARGAVQP